MRLVTRLLDHTFTFSSYTHLRCTAFNPNDIQYMYKNERIAVAKCKEKVSRQNKGNAGELAFRCNGEIVPGGEWGL